MAARLLGNDHYCVGQGVGNMVPGSGGFHVRMTEGRQSGFPPSSGTLYVCLDGKGLGAWWGGWRTGGLVDYASLGSRLSPGVPAPRFLWPPDMFGCGPRKGLLSCAGLPRGYTAVANIGSTPGCSVNVPNISRDKTFVLGRMHNYTHNSNTRSYSHVRTRP